MASIFRQRVIRFKKFEKLRWYETNKMDFGGRFGHAMCYHKPQNRVYVFGGINENKAMLNDLRYFCMRTRTWNLEVYESPERDGPEAMSFASLVSYKDSLILFGLFPNDCASSFRILVLDVPSRRWSTVYRNKPEEVVGNTFGHSAVVMEGKVIYFGGMTRNGIPCNRMFIYFPDTMAVQVVELENPPSPRVLSALAVLDSTRLLLVGGRTGIQPPFESYQDAFIVKFLDEEFKTATCTTLPIENPAAYPHSVYANSNTSDKMIIVSEPRDCTKVNLDSFCLRQLFGYDFSSERFVEVRHCKILTFLCLCRTTQDDVDQMDYDVYPRPQAGDRFISTDKVYKKKKIDNRYHLFAPQYPDIHDTMKLVWRDTVETVQHQRDFIMYPHDHFCIMLWFTKYHPLEECGNGQRCSSSCYRVGACIYRRMKELYRTEDEAFCSNY
ncbi:unnamed protein product [Bursaphelenchus okinawaensis]|uniref:Attractin/MKLN-like beta-propeller domain-containing protein n=1 Tax=Bursaphelenchus okinawaensis TaxID=465554 RepID=A0A811KMA2_9BILA|nr:unnamed protein product [Bursaphelenchus okinawaensis]CAG9106277.1 unnamed protein product [Bursaphelenchus okinawaensis]